MDCKEEFVQALQGKNIPILTLDNKWYRLFEGMSVNKNIYVLEQQLNDLLKRQGKLNTESKDIRKLKKKLVNEIVPMVDELSQSSDSVLESKIDQHQRLIAECNDKLDQYRDEMLDLPKKIEETNFNLMLLTMDYCYEKMKSNTQEIQEITEWVSSIRIELKKKLIRKQEREQRNHDIYSYMHDVFGAEVIEIFDMKYNPEEQHPKLPAKKETPVASDNKQAIQETKEEKMNE